MFKKFAKKVIAVALAATMAVSLAVVTMPQTAKASQGPQYFTRMELQRAGWTQGIQDPSAWSKEVNYTLRSVSDAGQRVAVYTDTTPKFDWSDGVSWSGRNTYSSIIDGVDIINGTVYVYASSGLSYMTNQTDRILITSNDGIYVGVDGGEALPTSYFTLSININVYDEGNTPDPTSLNEGWQTTDRGKTYTMSYDTYSVGEGMQGTSLPTAIPSLSTFGYFTTSDMTMDANASRFVKSAVMTGNNYLSITFVDNLTPFAQVGTSGTITFSKTVVNDVGAQAKYTLTIPLRVTNLANATVNGIMGPSTIYVNQGDKNGLRVSGIEDFNQAVVHWTTDSSGYVDVNNMNSMPKINSNGIIDVSSLAAGTYNFYIRSAGNLETRTFTLSVKAVAPQKGSKIYRMYNQADGDHIYTTNYTEVQNLLEDRAQRWMIEPESRENFSALATDPNAVPVYRMKDSASGEHLFTADTRERDVQSRNGWIVENNGQPVFYGVKSSNYPVYRLYNPKATNNKQAHLYTMDSREVNVRLSEGWSRDAGVAYYIMN